MAKNPPTSDRTKKRERAVRRGWGRRVFKE
jgi:hypothetical protein